MTWLIAVSLTGWNKIRPTLEAAIASTRDDRADSILRGSRYSLENRKTVLREAYTSYTDSLAPSTQVCMPSIEELSDFPDFKLVLYSDMANGILTEKHYDAAMKSLPGAIDIWTTKMKVMLHREVHEKDLNLATTVFLCKHCDEACIASDGVFRHECQVLADLPPFLDLDIPMSRSFRLDLQRSELAQKIIEMVGLDICNTTPQHLDSMEPLFLCDALECSKQPDFLSPSSMLYGILPTTWRGYVSSGIPSSFFNTSS